MQRLNIKDTPFPPIRINLFCNIYFFVSLFLLSNYRFKWTKIGRLHDADKIDMPPPPVRNVGAVVLRKGFHNVYNFRNAASK
jgi:hypothetical protein